MKLPFFAAMLAAALFAAPDSVRAQAQANAKPKVDPALLDYVEKLYGDIQLVTLDNGLKVYLKPMPGVGTVTTKVAYRVGSADEMLDHTGLSHYLEHLMFKGTEKLMPGDIDRFTQVNGGQNNAYTSEDMTVFHFDFAGDRWQKALEIEADRMRNLRIDTAHEFEQEKGAVIAELDGNEDEPWELEEKMILPLLFGPKHPYGHPVIGLKEHVKDSSAGIIKAHYDRWYHPNNAAIIVVGGFDPAAALAKIKELFGPIAKGELGKRPAAPPLPKRTETLRKVFGSKFETPRLMMGFSGVEGEHPDTHALDMLQLLLTQGKRSRLYSKLIEQEKVASAVDALNTGGRFPGWFSFKAECYDEDGVKKAEELILAELKGIAEGNVTDAELARQRRSILSSEIFASESIHSVADTIANRVITHDLQYLKDYLPKLLAVDQKDLARVAKKYFLDSPGIVIMSKGVPAPKKAALPRPPATRHVARTQHRDPAPAKSVGPGGELERAKRVVLPNGLTLLLLEQHRLPIVFAQAIVKDVRLREPGNQAGIAELVGEMLDEGTTTRTGEQISETLESLGADISLAAEESVKLLAPDRAVGIDILLDCLLHPTFPMAAFAREKELQISSLDDDIQQPQTRANMQFKKLVYGGHPLGRSVLGTEKTVNLLTIKECKKFHARIYVPNNTIMAVVGDFKTQDLIDQVTKATIDWKAVPLEAPKFPEVKRAEKPTQKIVTDATASQLHVYFGHVGIRRNDPDYHALEVMDNVLGTGPGFTDRLSANLRDRQGLAYTVRAAITSTPGKEPGAFVGYVGTFPDKFAVVKEGLLKELNRIRDEVPEAEEVERVKQYLLGGLPFRLESCASLAHELVSAEYYGLGLDYFTKYREAIGKVTPQQVRDAARKHLHPEAMIFMALGAIDQKGEALEPAGKD